MARFKAIFLEHGYKSVEPERRIVEAAGGEFIDGDQFSLEEAVRLAAEAEGIMLRRIPVRRDMINGFKKCRIILRYGVGVDNVELAAATDAGIIVGHVPVYCQDEVSTHAIALLLASLRRIVPTHERVRAGEWNVHEDEPMFRLAGKTLGIIGLGTLGQAVAKKLQGWDLRVLATDPYVGPEVTGAQHQTCPAENAPARFGLRVAARSFAPRDEASHKQRYPSLDEARRDPGEHGARAGRARPGSSRRVGQRAAELRRARCLRRRTSASRFRHSQAPRLIVTDHIAWYSEESQLELQRRAAEEVVRCCTGSLPQAIANPEVLQKLGRLEEWKPNYLARWQACRAAALSDQASGKQKVS